MSVPCFVSVVPHYLYWSILAGPEHEETSPCGGSGRTPPSWYGDSDGGLYIVFIHFSQMLKKYRGGGPLLGNWWTDPPGWE